MTHPLSCCYGINFFFILFFSSFFFFFVGKGLLLLLFFYSPEFLINQGLFFQRGYFGRRESKGTYHMYPYFLFAAIHHPKSSPTFSVRPRSSVGRVTVDLIRRSWVRFPTRSKDFFFASCGSLFPFIRANALWVIHGFK